MANKDWTAAGLNVWLTGGCNPLWIGMTGEDKSGVQLIHFFFFPPNSEGGSGDGYTGWHLDCPRSGGSSLEQSCGFG